MRNIKVSIGLLLALTPTLASCGNGDSPAPEPAPSPSTSVTGNWKGSLVLGSGVRLEVKLTQSGEAGNYTGTLTAIGTAKTTSASVAGNVEKGTFGSAFDSQPFSCQGKFTEYKKYEANCTLSNGVVTVYPTIYLEKR